MIRQTRTIRWKSETTAFTLVETLVVLAITSMVVIAVMDIYSNVRKNIASLEKHLEQSDLPREILQRMAEDLDRLARPGFDTSVMVRNKLKNGYNISQLIIENRFFGDQQPNKPQIYERITWQSDYDPYTDTIILYRAHSGIRLEDGLIDRAQLEKQQQGIEQFVPLTTGLTHFEIQIPNGDTSLKEWTQPVLPKVIRVLLSFGAPVQTETGDWIIPETDLFIRTIAIDRTRKIGYQFVKKDFDLSELDSADPNAISEEMESTDEETDTSDTDPKEKSKTPTLDKDGKPIDPANGDADDRNRLKRL